MAQKNLQTQTGQQVQTQQQVQQQQLLPQQVLLVRLTEMPVEALQQRVEQECMENPWLEVSASPDLSEGGEEESPFKGDSEGLSPSEGSGEASDALYDYRSE